MSRSHQPPPVARAASRVGGYQYRPDQLLISVDDVRGACDRLERTSLRPVSGVERLAGLDLCRVHLGGDERRVPVPEVVSWLRATCPGIRVAPNYVLRPSSHIIIRPTGAPEPIKRPFADQAAKGVQAGAGVRIGMIDTGYWDHEWFDGRVQGRLDGSDREADDDGRPFDLQVDGRTLLFGAGHGTFVAGVLLQHAPGATVIARRVAKPHEAFDVAEIDDVEMARAMADLADVDVLNLSLSTRVHAHEDHEHQLGADEEVLALLATANSLIDLRRTNPDMVIVAPAGNDYEVDHDASVWPAAFSSVLAVAGLDAHGEPASFTNRGPWVDACSRSVEIESTFLRWDGPAETKAPPDHDHHELAGDDHQREGEHIEDGAPQDLTFDGWARWSGTSFAAPRVAGAIAALMGEGMGDGMSAGAATAVALRAPSVKRIPDLGAVVEPHSYTTPA